MDRDVIDRIIDGYRNDGSAIIAILQDVQAEMNYLPKDVLTHVADELQIPLSRIYAIATFYNAFSLIPRGRHTIAVCLGTACHVKGGGRLLDRLEENLRIKAGATTPDMEFTLKTVRCIGCCGLAPALMVGNEVYGKLTRTQIPGIVQKYRKAA